MFKYVLVSFILFTSSALNASESNPSQCDKSAEVYAKAIAEVQYDKIDPDIKLPFKVIDVKEVTKQYFKEIGMGVKMTQHSKVYSVALESSNKWECQYYVLFKDITHGTCQLSTLVFDHCAQLS